MPHPRIALWLLLTTAPLAANCGAGELPRYKLHVGQELVYRAVSRTYSTVTSTTRYETEWTIDVVGRNDDGTCRLVFFDKRRTFAVYQGKETNYEIGFEGYFDLSEDGRTIENSTIAEMPNPTMVFPPLPRDARAMRDGWSATLTFDETRRLLRATSDQSWAKDHEWLLTEQPQSILSAVYRLPTRRDFVFDRKQGLVTRMTPSEEMNWADGAAELIRVAELDRVHLDALKEDASRYFGAKEVYDKLNVRAWAGVGNTAELLDEAASVLTKVRGELKLPLLQAIVDGKLKQHVASRQMALEEVEKRNKLIGTAPAWKTTDLSGNPRSLQDYAGQVVVLDFWFRNCVWCIRSMPHIKQLAADFQGQPVAVLGVNSDENVDDARSVVEAMQLNYPTLRNGVEEPITVKYGVNGWPTVVLLDGQGIVRHVHVGYRNQQELAEKVRKLLGKAE